MELETANFDGLKPVPVWKPQHPCATLCFVPIARAKPYESTVKIDSAMVDSLKKMRISVRTGVLLVFILIIGSVGSILLYKYLKSSGFIAEHEENFGGEHQTRVRLIENRMYPSCDQGGNLFLLPGAGEVVYYADGKEHKGVYYNGCRRALDWIRVNTPRNTTVLCWWQYGDMIVGLGERKTVVTSPSREILYTVADPSSVTEFSDHGTIVAVARCFTTADLNVTLQIMKNYGAEYILITNNERWIGQILFNISGLDYKQYLPTPANFTAKGKETVLYGLLFNVNLSGRLELVYEDGVWGSWFVRIYRRTD